MKRFLVFFVSAFLLVSCGDDGKNSTPPPEKVRVSNVVEGPNSHPIQVGGEIGICNGQNSLCGSIKICIPNTSTCQIITDLLIDTGSNGLRLFGSALNSNMALPAIQQTGNDLFECARFGSGNTWGPIKSVEVYLAQETFVTVPVQVIESTTQPAPGACSAPMITTPDQFGFNGILGVGLFEQDCGANCTATPNNSYFTCPAGVCADIATPLVKQVTNPVSKLTTNNNGVLVVMPELPETGAYEAKGSLVFGIDTPSGNNASTGATMYKANTAGDFTVDFGGQTYTTSHIDSGSNGWFFPTGLGVPACPADSPAAVAFCPSPTADLSLTAKGVSGGNQTQVFFKIANALDLIQTGNFAYDNLGLKINNKFILGMSFFYGRKVFVGIEGKTSPLGTGPYWAF